MQREYIFHESENQLGYNFRWPDKTIPYKKQILVSEKNSNQISNNKNINLSEAPEEVEIISDTIVEFVKILGDNCLKIVPQKNQQDYVLITVKIINFNHIFRKSI